MKIITAADLHMTAHRPINRIDVYEDTVLGKLDQILHWAMEYDAILALPGDLFDTVKLTKVPYEFTNKILQMIRLSKVRILACHGQHDMSYHNPNLQPSPYYTLFVGGGIEIPGALGITIGNVRFFGSGWGQEIPMPRQKDDDLIDVLLLHRTITPQEPPFYLKDATPAQVVLEKLYNYDLILSGDFHEPFISEMEDRWLVNSGPMLRADISKREYRPRVYLIDTDTAEITPLFLDIRTDVWNDERLEKQIQHDISVNTSDLLDAMTAKEDRPDYYRALDDVLKDVDDPLLVDMVKDVVVTAQKSLEGIK